MVDLGGPAGDLSPADRERLAAFQAATSLADLVAITGADDEHDAYLEAKAEWSRLRERDPEAVPVHGGLPGFRVPVGDRTFWIHGITHADTDAERAHVREHVREFVDRGAEVYCEQGVRRMYFSDVDAVCEMDDYRWAMQACATDEPGAQLPVVDHPFRDLGDDVEEFRSRLREATFSLLESNGDVFGERVKRTLGHLASSFLTSHEALGTADDFTSHSLSQRAARDPSLLSELQHYYETVFLPQPLEREWLRRHDPNLERATHARNERMADYAMYHVEDATEVHLIVGAAHQPGVRYYFEEHRDGERSVEGFQLC